MSYSAKKMQQQAPAQETPGDKNSRENPAAPEPSQPPVEKKSENRAKGKGEEKAVDSGAQDSTTA